MKKKFVKKNSSRKLSKSRQKETKKIEIKMLPQNQSYSIMLWLAERPTTKNSLQKALNKSILLENARAHSNMYFGVYFTKLLPNNWFNQVLHL